MTELRPDPDLPPLWAEEVGDQAMRDRRWDAEVERDREEREHEERSGHH